MDGGFHFSPGVTVRATSRLPAKTIEKDRFPNPELFGAGLKARIWLQNLGPDVALGLGEGYTMRAAITIPGAQDAVGTRLPVW